MVTEKTYRSELTPVDFLRRSARAYPDKIAVVHGHRRYSYARFAERVARLASGLQAAGLAAGDRGGHWAGHFDRMHDLPLLELLRLGAEQRFFPQVLWL